MLYKTVFNCAAACTLFTTKLDGYATNDIDFQVSRTRYQFLSEQNNCSGLINITIRVQAMSREIVFTVGFEIHLDNLIKFKDTSI